MKSNYYKLTLAALMMLVATVCRADGYTDAMTANLQKMESMKTAEDMQTIANTFDRIAKKDADKWLPKYYAAFLRVLMTYAQDDPKSIPARMDEADALINAALENPGVDSSEISCLQSMIATSRMMENPMKLGVKYGPMATEYLETARAQNPENPRVYLLQGESKYYTPKMWGGSKKQARELFLKAKEKYKSYSPSSDLAPNWGEDRVDKYLSEE